MAGWLVTLRGIRYRSGRSVVVFLLAVVATTAAVMAPAYARAAEQSALADRLRAVPPQTLGLTLFAGRDNADVRQLSEEVTPLIHQRKALAGVVDKPYLGATATVELSTLRAAPVSTLVYRSDLCAHVRLLSGTCPAAGSTDILIKADTARTYRLRVGDSISFGPLHRAHDPVPPQQRRHRISGIYQPRDPEGQYWWGAGHFSAEPGTAANPQDQVAAVLTTAPDANQVWPGTTRANAELDFPVAVDRIDMNTVPALRAELASLSTQMSQLQGRLDTALPDEFDAAGTTQHAIATEVPVVAVPLVLLCWFVLYLMVASLTEERSPEIALAKLRGFHTPATLRFGLGEALLPILLAAPVGLALGEGLVELVARTVLAAGTDVELRWPVLVMALAALAGAAVAAALAARRIIALPVMALLRRVPVRSRWRGTVVEGALVALAAAALYQALSDRSARLGLLAPPLLAFVVGLVAARLLGFTAGRRLRAARGRLPVPVLLSTAQLARRPIAQRLVLAVTVAVALLGFAATAWDVAGHARRQVAQDEIGAAHVYQVRADGPQQLRNAVRHIDPTGRYLMPAMQSEVHYGDGTFAVLAVDPARLPAVATWSGRSTDQVRAMARRITDPAPAPVTVHGPLRVEVSTSVVTAARPLQVMALIAQGDQEPREVELGALTEGRGSYRAALPGCAAGCRLTGLGLARYPGDSQLATARFTIASVRDGDRVLRLGLDAPGRWRHVPDGTSQTTVRAVAGTGLRVDYTTQDPNDMVVSYATTPTRLPAVLAGAAPADDPASDRFSFPAFGDRPLDFQVTDRTRVVPRAGSHALLMDIIDVQRLHAAQLAAVSSDDGQPIYQVWAAPGAPSGLVDRLSAAGLSVRHVDSLTTTLNRLGRQAPALALRLYLMAGVAALLLAVGAVLLTAHVGVDARRDELAALQVVGVSRAVLARATRREYRTVVGVPLVAGLLVGAAGAVLMLPAINLVTPTDAGVYRVYQLGPYWVPGAVLASVVTLFGAAALMSRMLGRARPDRLRARGQ